MTRNEWVNELTPLAPHWRSTGPPHRYFGGSPQLARDASRCDSPATWISWIGACAALELIRSLDSVRVERHCLGLARQFAERAETIGLPRVTDGPDSHIVVLRSNQAKRLADRLREHRIRATAIDDRIRFGFHYFNDEHDSDAVLDALACEPGR